MEVNSLTQYLNELQAQKVYTQRQMQSSESSQTGSSDTDFSEYMDQYIPSIGSMDENAPMPSENYNQMSNMGGGNQAMDQFASQIGATDTDSDTTVSDTSDEEDSAAGYSVGELMNQISENMRVSQDSIQSAMDDLGLTASDLFDSDNMSQLTSYLNEGAEALGLPTVDDLDSVTSSLSTTASEISDELESTYSLDDDELEELLQSFEDKLKEFNPFGVGAEASESTDTTTDATEEATAAAATAATTAATSTANSASTTDAVTSSVSELLNEISEEMRVNQDTLQSAMSELGLTTADLFDSEKMAELTSYLNDGAEALGLPTADDLDSVTSSLSSTASDISDDLEDTYSLDETALEELLQEIEERMKEYNPFGVEEETTDSTDTESTTTATETVQTV